MANLIITIDGPAASGKSTVAQLLAERLGASFLDTGAMYRAVTLAAIESGVDMGDEEKLLGVLETSEFKFAAKKDRMCVFVDGVDVTEQIRGTKVTANAHYVASAVKLREKLVQMQRKFAAGEERIVTEGRDQGTVAFPDADIKFYLTADVTERARRRLTELRVKGGDESLEQIQNAIEERDRADASRAVGPLRPAGDAIVVDTTDLSIEEVVEKLSGCIEKMLKKKPKMRWFRFARWLCKVFCNLFFRIQVYGRENVPDKGAFVLVSNHQSYLDPVFCGIPLKRPLYFLARDSLFDSWFFGWLISSVNTIPVRRGKPDLAAVKKVIGKLKEGGGVCLFPEGTRTMDGRIMPFKGGFGLLCRRGGASVVPVLIDGAFECWPRHKKIFSSGSIVVCYGKAIPAEKVKEMSERELAEVLTDTLRRMQAKSRIEQGKEPLKYCVIP